MSFCADMDSCYHPSPEDQKEHKTIGKTQFYWGNVVFTILIPWSLAVPYFTYGSVLDGEEYKKHFGSCMIIAGLLFAWSLLTLMSAFDQREKIKNREKSD